MGIFLYRAFISAVSKGESLPSHREGIITLIPKQGKSPHSTKGWRPISLLNVDYKIISSAIAARLKRVMNELISPSQTAYIKGRYIGENTRLLFDMISWTKSKDIPGIILAADFQAAFESVSWTYLRLVLQKMNFGPHFQRLVDLLYLNPQNHSRILLNGHLGEKNIFESRNSTG